MTNRRDVLRHGTGLLLTTALAGPLSVGCAPIAASGSAVGVRSARPVTGTFQNLGGLGDGYKMTLNQLGQQIVVVNDGPGWMPPPATFFSTRLWTVEGSVSAPAFGQLAGYPVVDRAMAVEGAPHYYGHGMIAVGPNLYQFLATLDAAEDRPRRWTGAKLIYSPDNGATWYNQNGTAPVRWEQWDEQSRSTLAFFNEPDGCFSLLAFLQEGVAYAVNRDGYIYAYGLNGSVDGLMNQLVMFRVAKGDVLNRGAYEFFAGRDASGGASWSSDIAKRAVVHEYPLGWVNRTNLFPGDLVVESWLPSVVWNAGLGLYMMSSAGIGSAEDGTAFGRPSYLGIWVSENPWGPWRQVHEDPAWAPNGDVAARAYAPQIAPGWISPDGRSFTLVWADLKGLREFGDDGEAVEAEMNAANTPQERTTIEAAILKRYMPGFSMNVQTFTLE